MSWGARSSGKCVLTAAKIEETSPCSVGVFTRCFCFGFAMFSLLSCWALPSGPRSRSPKSMYLLFWIAMTTKEHVVFTYVWNCERVSQCCQRWAGCDLAAPCCGGDHSTSCVTWGNHRRQSLHNCIREQPSRDGEGLPRQCPQFWGGVSENRSKKNKWQAQ